ncbi:homeobox protein cut [Anaeramoeba ignava]|uniref:Protein CASP n=1 Tax=Anaeramoeba ignava TaxID=1746090 RepID=A0A9Q0L5Z5_ANAIG|nr:homeobox protein cut [Anaeramoeba ignava]
MNLNQTVEQTIQIWKNFDFENKRSEFDENSLKIGEFQENSTNSRKQLSKETKNFLSLQNTEKLKKFSSLIKNYQKEIDSLTERAKFSEKSILSIYQFFSTAPDPTPILELILKEYIELEKIKENYKQNENSEKNSNSKKQLLLIEDLKNKNQQMKKDFENQLEEKKLQYELAIQELNQKLQKEQENFKLFQSNQNIEQNEIFELKTKHQQELNAKEKENEMISLDLQNAHLRISELEKNIELLKNPSNNQEDQKQLLQKISKLENNYQEKMEQINEFEEQIKELEQSTNEKEVEILEQKQKFQKEKEKYEDKIEELNLKLTSLPNEKEFSKIKKELEILKTVEFGFLNEKDFENENENEKEIQNEKGLKLLLLKKSRHLENQVTKFKVELNKKQQILENLTQQNSQLNESLNQSQNLIKKLESDLLIAQKERLKGNISTQEYENINNNNLSNQNDNNTKNSIIEIEENEKQIQSDKNEQEKNEKIQQKIVEQKKMFDIVCQQRDRFRNQLEQMENKNQELSFQYQECSKLNKRLQADNLKFYEKIKFLQNYQQTRSNPNSKINFSENIDSGLGLNSSRIENDYEKIMNRKNEQSDLIQQYKEIYDEGINPFNEFSIQERNSQYQNLHPIEKITLKASKFILSNRNARFFLFFYTILIHLITIILLFILI